MRLCTEVLIPKAEKERIMKQFYKKGSALLSNEEKRELFQYFAELSKIDENDQVRKKKFLIEFTVLKLIKNFLNRQKSLVKQTDLKNNFNDSSNMTENVQMSLSNKKVLFDKIRNSIKPQCLKTETDENYQKFAKKLKNLKNDSPSNFEKLYIKFQKTKEKCEQNIQNIN